MSTQSIQNINPSPYLVEIWMEGYAATGESGTAFKIGEYMAFDLNGAIVKYINEHPNSVDWERFGPSKHAIWGCRLFDNEKEARKSFG